MTTSSRWIRLAVLERARHGVHLLLGAHRSLLGVVRPAEAGAGAAFALDYPRYIAITFLAYTWTVSVLTLLVVSLRLGATVPGGPIPS